MKNTDKQNIARLTEKEIGIYLSGSLNDTEPWGKDNALKLLVEELGFIKRYNQDTGKLDRLCINYKGRDIMYIHVDPSEEYGYLTDYSACVNNNEELELVVKILLELQKNGAYVGTF